MFSIIWSKKKGSFLGSSSCKGYSDDDDQGLRLILTKLAANDQKSSNTNNVVFNKPIFLINKIVMMKPLPPDHQLLSNYCYLKSCHLCHKHLNLDKEIYMYRGDLGFCSVECRDRQIYLDEKKEIEIISTQKILSSFRHRKHRYGVDGRCETRQLLEDFRKRRHPFSSQKDRVIFL